MSIKPLIDVTGLTKSYDGKTAVRDVTMCVQPGEIVGLVGANGGGKTTTLRLLAGLLSPDAGEGNVLGDDIRHPQPGRRHRIGYMSQRLALHAELSVWENLRFHAAIHELSDRKKRLGTLVEKYGLNAVLKQPFGELSGGWARRVQFAVCTLHSPSLLLLDEPTAGLDTVARRKIWLWLTQLAAAGHGIVISTHDLVEAEQCAKIVFYHLGRAHLPVTPGTLVAEAAAPSFEAAIEKLAEGHA